MGGWRRDPFMRSLDDPAVLDRADPAGMLRTMGSYVDGFAQAFRQARSEPVRAPPALSHVLLCGMGGSGIGGDVMRALVEPSSRVPVSVVKDYQLPAFVNDKSLVIAVSYSGETEETLRCAAEAKQRGASLVAVASGGQLAALAKGPHALHLKVPGGLQPRAALPHLLGTLLGIADTLHLAPLRFSPDLEAHARKAQEALVPAAPESKNPAKKFARGLHDKLPVWCASAPLGPVALRGRCQLNENAKMFARQEELPEANHNDLVPWSKLDRPEHSFVGFLRQRDEPPEIHRRFDFLHSLLKRRKVPHMEYLVRDSPPMARVLEALMFVDYTSVYAAVLRGVDPTPVEIIGELKQRLARRGRVSALA